MADQDYSSDYGYDLADEVRSMSAGATDRRLRTPLTGIRGTAFDPSADGDLGYDSAHEA
jgi:hypothetical protein